MRNPFQIDTTNESLEMNLPGYSKRDWEGDFYNETSPHEEILTPAINSKKIDFLSTIFLVSILILLVRVFYLQVIHGDYYRALSEGHRARIEIIKAPRGIIYDRQGIVLTENASRFVLSVIPSYVPKAQEEKQRIIDQLSIFLSPEQVEELVENFENMPIFARDEIPLVKNLNYQQAMLLKIKTAEMNGINVIFEPLRKYQDGSIISHLIGYVGKISPEEIEKNKNYSLNDYIGKSGLEFFYENLLRGIDGKKRIEMDRLVGEDKIISAQPPQPGHNLILTIDIDLQKKLTEVLNFYVQNFNGRGGAAIALNPNNGEILAIASYPTFDNNLFSQHLDEKKIQKILNHPLKPLFFRAVAGQYLSGSIIKPLVAAAALEEKIITPKTQIYSSGGIQYDQWFYPDWKAGGHGPTDVIKALAESVNTFFYYIGGGYKDFTGLGIEKMTQWFKKFGLGSLTGIDLPEEATGLVPTPEWKKEVKNEIWYPGNTYHLAIGQGDILVTPLQVVNYTAAIANGGTLYQPYLVQKIVNPNTQEEEIIKPKIIRSNIASDQNLEIVRRGMRAAVTRGSARGLNNLPIKVAAKTGTAQVGGNMKPHAWLTCWAPYENPEIVLTVLIENGGEGSVAALPVARDVLKWWFTEKR